MSEESPSGDPLVNYIAERLSRGRTINQIVEDLITLGVEPVSAAYLVREVNNALVREVNNARKANQRASALGSFGCAITAAAVGGVVTLVTYLIAEPGGTYIITTGLFVVAGISAVVGLTKLFG